jgi:hypothetical protein
MKNILRKYIHQLPRFNKQKLLLSFEYGVIIGDVAREKGMVVTPEMVVKAEEMILSEFLSKSPERLSVEMIPNILATFETKLESS